MRTKARDIFRIAGAAALLSACGGPPSSPSNPVPVNVPALARLAHAGSWIAPDASSQSLIYMGQFSEVAIFTFRGKQVGALKGLSPGGSGLCSDSSGNVWVTYGDSLLEYAHAGTIPIAQVYAPSTPFSCAVDPSTGNLAATEDSENQGNNVAVFPNLYGTPQTYTDPDFYGYTYCSYDDQGNLFVNGVRGKNVPLAELPVGGGALRTITLDQKIARLGGLQWDGKYLAMGDSLTHVIYQFAIANGQATTETTTRFKGWTGRFKSVVPFAIANGEIVFTFSKRQTGVWNFPAGGRSIRRMNVVGGAVTISVASSGSRKGGQM